MGMFFIYSIKVAICLVAFYLFYKLLLSRDTFHAFNRATLLLLMLLSLVLPFVSLSIDEPTVVNNGMVQVEQLLVAGVTGEDIQPASLTLVQVLFIWLAWSCRLGMRSFRWPDCTNLFPVEIM